MKTFLDFVSAVKPAAEKCAFCSSRTASLTVVNLARDLRELNLPNDDKPFAIRLCETCADQYRRLLTKTQSDGKSVGEATQPAKRTRGARLR